MPGVCPRCSKNVYFAEEFRFSGSCWHKMCLACTACGKLLTPGGMLDHGGKLYCSRCYGVQFGPTCYGYGGMVASSSPVQTPYTPPVDQEDRIRTGGGWVSPRLIRSTRKLLEQANIDPGNCQRPVTFTEKQAFLTPPTVNEAQSRELSGCWVNPRGLHQERSTRTKIAESFWSSEHTGIAKETAENQTQVRVRAGGGWIGPRLDRSTQKQSVKMDTDPDKRSRTPAAYQSGGVTHVEGRPVRKVSAGSGQGIGSGGYRRQGTNYHSRRENIQEPKAGESPSATPSIKMSFPSTMLGSNSKPALLLPGLSDELKSQPQLCLRKAFNHPQYKSSVKQVPPPSNARTPAPCPPLSGYKPKLSPLVSAPSVPTCTRCGKAVYQAELARACGRVYHRSCFTCEKCGKTVSSGNLCERKGLIYCRHCYQAYYGPNLKT